MIESVLDSTRWLHIVAGFGGLVAFWIPAFARKGGKTHVRTGRVFEWAAYLVAGSAVFNAIGRLGVGLARGATLENNRAEFGFIVFLAYIGVVTFASVRHGVRSLRLKRHPEALASPAHRALAVGSMAGSVGILLYAVFIWSDISVVLLALSPLGILQGREMMSQMRKTPSETMWWFYAHMGNMIGAGIAFHTAFLVFGFNRIIPLDLPGIWQVVPWILPAAIGIPVHRIVEARYRRRFGESRRGHRGHPPELTASA